MNTNKLLSNKWVWIGGGVLGVVALLSSRGGSSGGAVSSGVVLANAVEMNRIGTSASIEAAKIAAARAGESAKINLAMHQATFGYLNAAGQQQTVIKAQQEETRRAINLAGISTSAARDIERQQTMRAVSGAVIGGNTQTRVIQAQGDATKALVKAQKPSTGELIVGGIGNAAKLAASVGRFFI